MIAASPSRGTTEKRSPPWAFTEMSWIRHHLLQRASRLTEPQGNLTLTLSGNDAVKRDLLHFLDALKETA